MIIKWLLSMVLTIFSGLDQILIPALPSAVVSVLDTIFTYIVNGLKWVFVFLDREYCSQLFTWWITFGAVILSYELIYAIWHMITGNAHSKSASYEGSESTISYADDGTVISQTQKHWSRK